MGNHSRLQQHSQNLHGIHEDTFQVTKNGHKKRGDSSDLVTDLLQMGIWIETCPDGHELDYLAAFSENAIWNVFVPEINCGIGFADVGISIDETWISSDFLNDSSILILIVTVIFASYAPGRAPLSLSAASRRLQVDHQSLLAVELDDWLERWLR